MNLEMKMKIGIDLLEIERINLSKNFLNKILTENEQKFIEKFGYLIEWNYRQVIVKVDMAGTRNEQELFVIASQSLVGILTEVAGMGF